MMRIAVAPETNSSHIQEKDSSDFRKVREQLADKKFPRQKLAEILFDYNQSIGNDAAAFKQIKALEQADSVCVVTGQQLGLMGGPSYTILKGITCLLTARANGAIPIFWLATDDHDIAEIDHTYLLDGLGNLQAFHLNLPKDGRAVEDLELTEKNIEVIHQFLQTVEMEKDWVKIDNSYAKTMARLMVRLFAGTGMVFLEPRFIRFLAKDFWRRELEETVNIQRVLHETNSRLKASSIDPILTFEAGTNLFLKVGEKRLRLHHKDSSFIAGEKHYTLKELLAIVEKYPEQLGTNVASRPLLQSNLLPTLAYIAGPNELIYYRELTDYHQWHESVMPCIVPRLSASLIPPFAAELLEKCGLKPWEKIPHHWKDLFPTLMADGEAMELDWLRSAVRYFSNDASDDVLMRYIRMGERKLLRKVTKERLHKQQIPSYGLHLLRNLLHPHDKPQERVLNWFGFQKYSKNLVEECLKSLDWKSGVHQYIYL